MNETGPALDRWTSALTQFRDYEVKSSIESAARAHEAYVNSRSAMLALSLTALLVSLGVCIVITRGLTRQLGGEPDYAAGIVELIADGDLGVTVLLRGNDRTSLLYSMQLMQSKLEAPSVRYARVRIALLQLPARLPAATPVCPH